MLLFGFYSGLAFEGKFQLIFDCSGKKFAVIQYYLTLLVLFLFYFQLKAEKHAVKSRKARSKIALKNYLAI